MDSASVIRIMIRGIVLAVIQIVLLQHALLGTSIGAYAHLFIYPLWILLLPVGMRPVVVLLLAMGMGMLIDIFYATPGFHASALVWTALMRGVILRTLMPRERYEVQALPVPEQMGWAWYLRYLLIALLLHCVWYYLVDDFTITHLHWVLLKASLTALLSCAVMILYTLLIRAQ